MSDNEALIHQHDNSIRDLYSVVGDIKIQIADIKGDFKVTSVKTDNIEKTVNWIKEDIEKNKDKPSKYWDTVKITAITVVVSSIVVGLMSLIILGGK